MTAYHDRRLLDANRLQQQSLVHAAYLLDLLRRGTAPTRHELELAEHNQTALALRRCAVFGPAPKLRRQRA